MSRDPQEVALVRRLTAARKRRNLSQSTLAVLMDVSQQSLSSWETGTAMPPRRSLRVWALTLRVTPPAERPAVREKCGSYAGWSHHKRHGEQQCDACTDANAEYMNAYRGGRPVRRATP